MCRGARSAGALAHRGATLGDTASVLPGSKTVRNLPTQSANTCIAVLCVQEVQQQPALQGPAPGRFGGAQESHSNEGRTLVCWAVQQQHAPRKAGIVYIQSSSCRFVVFGSCLHKREVSKCSKLGRCWAWREAHDTASYQRCAWQIHYKETVSHTEHMYVLLVAG